MRTIEIAQAPTDDVHLLEQARQEDLIIRLGDGSEFLVAAIEDFDQEIARTRNHAKLMAFLEVRAQQTATIPLDEVKRRLGL